jgi:hypothetical protein
VTFRRGQQKRTRDKTRLLGGVAFRNDPYDSVTAGANFFTFSRYRRKLKCAERERLWEAYDQALNVLTECVEQMSQPFTATSIGPLMIATQAAKDICKQARDAWEEHLRVHGCDENPG